jgi:hypothetical protein
MIENSKFVRKVLILLENNLNVIFYMWNMFGVYKIIIFSVNA